MGGEKPFATRRTNVCYANYTVTVGMLVYVGGHSHVDNVREPKLRLENLLFGNGPAEIAILKSYPLKTTYQRSMVRVSR